MICVSLQRTAWMLIQQHPFTFLLSVAFAERMTLIALDAQLVGVQMQKFIESDTKRWWWKSKVRNVG